MARSLVWYTIHTTKSVAANIPDQGSFLYRQICFKSNLRTRFAMNQLILSNIEFSCGFSVVSHLELVPY